MATNYPGSLDSLPRPTSTTAMDAAGYEGDVVIDNLSDAVEAIETELGTDPAGAQATVKARLELSHYGARANRWVSGGWFLSDTYSYTNSVSATDTGFADRIWYWPFLVPESVTIDRIGLQVATAGAAGDNIRMGMYAASETTWLPTGSAVTDFGEIDASSTGVKQLTISQALTGGSLVWFAAHFEANSIDVVVATTTKSPPLAGVSQTPTSALYGMWYQTGATYASGLPTVGTLTGDTAPPTTFLRRT